MVHWGRPPCCVRSTHPPPSHAPAFSSKSRVLVAIVVRTQRGPDLGRGNQVGCLARFMRSYPTQSGRPASRFVHPPPLVARFCTLRLFPMGTGVRSLLNAAFGSWERLVALAHRFRACFLLFPKSQARGGPMGGVGVQGNGLPPLTRDAALPQRQGHALYRRPAAAPLPEQLLPHH